MTAGRSRADDLASFEGLFERHHRQVLAYCLRRSETQADAEDAAADVFAVAWRRRDTMPEPAIALPWLYAIARRTLANQRRGNDRRARLASHLEVMGTNSPTHDRAGPAIDALQRLSTGDRELLRLVAWEGLRRDEIATALGITANAVAIRLHRARIRFEQQLRTAPTAEPLKEIEGRRTSTRLKGRMIGRLRREAAE